MAKKTTGSSRTSLEEFNDSLTGIGQKVEKNKKIIYWGLGGLLAVLLGVGGWYYLYKVPRDNKAKEAISEPQMKVLMNPSDSTALADFEAVAQQYGGTKAGNLAYYHIGVLKYDAKDYEGAAAALEKYDADSRVLGSAALTLLGDCYVNLDKLDDAVKAYDKAIKKADENPDFVPYIMMKKATVLREQEKFGDEVKVYEELKEKYPLADQANNKGGTLNVDFYLERAKAQAGQ